MKPRRVAESETTLGQVMMPSDANSQGNVHGGTIMKLVDTAGGIASIRHARHRVVTVIMDSMTFLEPVYVGDLVTIHARLTWTGRTSMETEVRVEAEKVASGVVTHTSTAYLVYVALDDDGKPCPVPPLELVSDDERLRWQQAEARRDYRLAAR
jgi:uncharacterized protein (TIGR00369 family)